MSATAKSTLLEIDTRDDRRELWSLLHRLSPGDRVRFLKWAVDQVAHPTGVKPYLYYRRGDVEHAYRRDEMDLRITNLAYGDLLMLGSQWKVDMVAVAKNLERWARAAG